MAEEAVDLDTCFHDGLWVCPVSSCQKKLSRKQTLKIHLSCIHSIKGRNPVKRYKKYEHDSSESKPKTTKWREKRDQSSKHHNVEDHGLDKEDYGSAEGDHEDMSAATLGIVSDTDHSSNNRDIDGLHNLVEFEYDENSETEIGQIEEILVENKDVQYDNMDIEVDSNGERSDNEDSEGENLSECETETEPDEEIRDNDSVPLYVLPPSSCLYSSAISHKDHLLLISAFATRNNLSRTAFTQLLKLIDNHLPEKNLCEKNVNRVKEKIGFGGNYFRYFDYCDICGLLYPTDKDIYQCKTPGCKGTRFKEGSTTGTAKNFFVCGDLQLQLNEILENEDTFAQISANLQKKCSNNIDDITDGKKYQEMKSKYKDMTISLTMFTDGVSLFKSSKVSLWPVYLVINEINPQTRFIKKNMILWGLWQGQGKPIMNSFLYPFVKEMRELYQKGITIETSTTPRKIYAITNALTMDLQARACMFNMTQHNGAFSCIFCEEQGIVVKSGKGHTRSFPYRDIKPQSRTKSSIEQNIESAIQTKKMVCGFSGKTILSKLPFVEVNENCTIDYMHGFLLGITKKLMTLWFEGSSFQQPYFIGHKLKDIDKALKSFKVPYIIHRTPRKIENNLSHWKASEFRSFLLYYGIPCLKDILPSVYLDHFACFVEATYLLLQRSISKKDLERAQLLLDTFYKCMSSLYGDAVCGLNVHNTGHIVKCVENWGPLWAYSCFSFESFNGEITKSIHGKGNVSGEVYWAVHSEKILENEIKSLPDGQNKSLLREIMRSHITVGENSEIGEHCFIVKPLIKLTITPTVAESLADLMQKDSDEIRRIEFFKASKIQRNSFMFYSSSCGKVKQKNSFTLLLGRQFLECDIIQVDYYIHSYDFRKTFAVGCGLSQTSKLLHQRVPHIQRTVVKRKDLVIPVSLLEEPMVFMDVNGEGIVARFPNFIERD